MKNKLILILVIAAFGTSFLNAQTKLRKNTNTNYDVFAYAEVIELYKKKSGKESPNVETCLEMANSYYSNSNFKQARVWYRRALELDSSIDPEYYFRFALTLKSAKKYEEADKWLEKFVKAKPDDSRGQIFLKKRDYLEKIAENSGRYLIKKQGFNSRFNDFAPTFNKDLLIFSSSRDTIGFNVQRHSWNNASFYDLYEINPKSIRERKKNRVSKLLGDVNTKLHESTSTITKDGNTMYFTRNNYYKGTKGSNAEGRVLLKIYKAEKNKKGRWGNVQELPFNDDSYSTAHPALNNDETKLYFVSDRPGSLGGSDIYMIDIDGDGSFGKPKNLGPKINTEGRESFPYITKSNKLFFSSDGLSGLGGLDIFAANISDINSPSFDIYNVGEPINSPFDDFGIIINEDTNEGYFASNRKGGKGGDDIYGFVHNSRPIITPATPCLSNIKGTVINRETNEPLANVELVLLEATNVLNRLTTTKTGDFQFEVDCVNKTYLVTADIPGFNYYEATVTLTKMQVDPTIKLVPTTAIEKGMDLAKILKLNPIYFDSNKSNIRPDAEIELQKIIAFMKQNPFIKVQVGSHTDGIGKASYNLSLSERRARSTVQYIMDNGIDPERISGQGYGETKLINRCKYRGECSQTEHAINRRSEFIVTTAKNIGLANLEISTNKQLALTNPITIDSTTTEKTGQASNNSFYTVQLGARRMINGENRFKVVDHFQLNHPEDRITRYYTGKFTTVQDAIAHKKKMLEKGFAEAFVLKLVNNSKRVLVKQE